LGILQYLETTRSSALQHGSTLSSTRYTRLHAASDLLHRGPSSMIHQPPWTDSTRQIDQILASFSSSLSPAQRFSNRSRRVPRRECLPKLETKSLVQNRSFGVYLSPSRPLIGPIIGAYRRILVSGPPWQKMCATDAIDLGVLRPSRFPAFQARGCPCCRSAAGGRERRWCERHRIR
jgi:hypothetical protein